MLSLEPGLFVRRCFTIAFSCLVVTVTTSALASVASPFMGLSSGSVADGVLERALDIVLVIFAGMPSEWLRVLGLAVNSRRLELLNWGIGSVVDHPGLCFVDEL